MYFIYLFTTLFNVGHTIVTRLIKTNLTKTNTDIIDKDFKIFSMQHKNSKSLLNVPGKESSIDFQVKKSHVVRPE